MLRRREPSTLHPAYPASLHSSPAQLLEDPKCIYADGYAIVVTLVAAGQVAANALANNLDDQALANRLMDAFGATDCSDYLTAFGSCHPQLGFTFEPPPGAGYNCSGPLRPPKPPPPVVRSPPPSPPPPPPTPGPPSLATSCSVMIELRKAEQ